MNKKTILMLFACTLLVWIGFSEANADELAKGLTYKDPYTLVGSKHLIKDYPAVNADGTVNAVIEIPTGTVAKWEVDKADGLLKWEFKKGKPREVKYLGYPGNYGMIPQTVLLKSEGGDGDSLDVLVLGKALPRGVVIPVKVIGALKLLDGDEQDDKLIAVVAGSIFDSCESIKDLDKKFPGISKIIETWFESYKGSGEMKAKGFASAKKARKTLKVAVEGYLKQIKSKKQSVF
jgi:inorganic pyrophosphatase